MRVKDVSAIIILTQTRAMPSTISLFREEIDNLIQHIAKQIAPMLNYQFSDPKTHLLFATEIIDFFLQELKSFKRGQYWGRNIRFVVKSL